MRKEAILLLLEQHRGPIWGLGRLDKACIQQVCQLLPKFCQFQGRHPIRCTCRGLGTRDYIDIDLVINSKEAANLNWLNSQVKKSLNDSFSMAWEILRTAGCKHWTPDESCFCLLIMPPALLFISFLLSTIWNYVYFFRHIKKKYPTLRDGHIWWPILSIGTMFRHTWKQPMSLKLLLG